MTKKGPPATLQTDVTTDEEWEKILKRNGLVREYDFFLTKISFRKTGDQKSLGRPGSVHKCRKLELIKIQLLCLSLNNYIAAKTSKSFKQTFFFQKQFFVLLCNIPIISDIIIMFLFIYHQFIQNLMD